MPRKVNCASCKFSNFSLTPTGRIRKRLAGRCDYPGGEELSDAVLSLLPLCLHTIVLQDVLAWRKAIWPDYQDCPVWEGKPQ